MKPPDIEMKNSKHLHIVLCTYRFKEHFNASRYI